jgi:hypothetical protein
MKKFPSRAAIEEALADAARAHHDYEVDGLKGVRDALWPGFYAAFVLGRLGDFTSASRLARLLEGVAAKENWSAAAAEAVVCEHGG